MNPVTFFTPRARRVSRMQAFEAQGVTLSFPVRSWSGVRRDGGSVVIAMREVDVRGQSDGYRCLLWSPALHECAQWLDRPSRIERLQHCRFAALLGIASGLLAHGAAGEVERDEVVRVRVVAHADEYWATWGQLARAESAPRRAAPRIAAASAYC